MEMIKGIKGHGYYDKLVVPIIKNMIYKYQLTKYFAKAIEDYPKATAVLVRNHGCYHYLFDATLKLHQMGLDWSTPNHGPIQSARRGLSIAGESNVSVKARKSNGDSDPFPALLRI
ncbi:putative bifunctional methylthioribulose-1-phosphate dehydratase/enolase-phosphatase E1 [Glycine soja]